MASTHDLPEDKLLLPLLSKSYLFRAKRSYAKMQNPDQALLFESNMLL